MSLLFNIHHWVLLPSQYVIDWVIYNPEEYIASGTGIGNSSVPNSSRYDIRWGPGVCCVYGIMLLLTLRQLNSTKRQCTPEGPLTKCCTAVGSNSSYSCPWIQLHWKINSKVILKLGRAHKQNHFPNDLTIEARIVLWLWVRILTVFWHLGRWTTCWHSLFDHLWKGLAMASF